MFLNLCLNILGNLNLISPTFDTLAYLVIYNKIHQGPFISTDPIYILVQEYQALSLITPLQFSN